MNLVSWTAPPHAPRPVAPLDEVSQLRQELAAAQIRIATLEAANQQWAEMHRSSLETWKAELDRVKAALVDIHTAFVYDRMSPEDRPLAGMVLQ